MNKKTKAIISVFLTTIFMIAIFGVDTPVYADAFPDVTIIPPGNTVEKTINDSVKMQYEYFEFDVKSTGMVKIDIRLEDVKSGTITFYNSDKEVIKINDSSWQFISTESSTKIGKFSVEKVFEPGVYYVEYMNSGYRLVNGKEVYVGGKIKATYSFTDLNINTSIDKAGNDSIPKAAYWDYKAIPSFNGALSYYPMDKNDFYKINVQSENDLRIRVESSFACLVTIYNEDGKNEFYEWTKKNDALGKRVLDKEIYLPNGTWYVCLSGDVSDWTGYYTLMLSSINTDNGSAPDSNTGNNGGLHWMSDAGGWWLQDSTGWYPTNQWQIVDGKWYYFCANGYMDYSEYRDGCWLGSDGAWVEAYGNGHWCHNSRGWWYEDNGWYPCNQYLWIDGVRYWFGADGYWY